MKRVLVTVPNAGKQIHKETVLSLLRLKQDDRYELTIKLPTKRPLANNQHHIINDIISENYDYWLSIDADVAPNRNPLNLIELDKDIIGCPTPGWRFKEPLDTYPDRNRPVYCGAYGYDKEKDAHFVLPQGRGLQEVDAISGGCFIMARRVFDNKLLRTRGWWRRLNKDGTVYMSNDFSFCWRAKKEGFRIWVHWDYIARHYKEAEMTSVLEIFNSLTGLR